MDRFLIAPYKTGVETDERSWLLTEDAFTELQNAYVFRGRVRKRFGTKLMGVSQLISRLRASLAAGGAGIGITDVTGAAAGNVRTILGDATLPLAVGQMFSIGMAIYTVISNAAGAQPMLATQGSATFNITNGDFTITGGPALTTIFFYPGFPVMGLTQYESGAINNHPTYAFDTRYAYFFTPNVGWDRSDAAVWHGTDLNFFWATNWQGVAGAPVLFVSNFNATVPTPAATDDPIWYMVPANTWTAASGANAFYFLPNNGAIHTGPFVQTARIILPFKNRLLLLNTVENDNSGGAGVNTAYVNRVRYSFNGSPFARNAWYEPNQIDSSGGVVNNNNIAAGAGFIDASTEEQIISAEFIKDRLIVYFERSTWELVYNGNEILPFYWQKINTELGSQATFSTVPFDLAVLTVGNTGIHACTGTEVARIDNKIPDVIFEFETDNNATFRTVGIRDYVTELVYWTYVSVFEQQDPTVTQTYPDQILIYNYKNGTWAHNDDCFTMFGYLEQSSDTTWASSTPLIWQQANQTWIDDVLQANQRQIIAGNQEGWVLIIASGGTFSEAITRNAPSLQITQIKGSVVAVAPAFTSPTGILTLTIINHNLTMNPTWQPYDQDFILIENISAIADTATATYLNGRIYPVFSVVDANTITINTQNDLDSNGNPTGGLLAGTYSGGGTVARVSNIQLTTKRFNPYITQNQNVFIQKIDFGVQKTVSGEITVDYFPSSTEVSMIQGGVASGAIMGSSILETKPYSITFYPLEQYQELLWHTLYFDSYGEYLKFSLYFNPSQMINPNISLAGFELEGMTLYAQPVGRLQ